MNTDHERLLTAKQAGDPKKKAAKPGRPSFRAGFQAEDRELIAARRTSAYEKKGQAQQIRMEYSHVEDWDHLLTPLFD